MNHFRVRVFVFCLGLCGIACGTESTGTPAPGAQSTPQVPATPMVQTPQLPVQPGIPQPGTPPQGTVPAVKQIPGYVYIPPGTFNAGTGQGTIPRCPGNEMIETPVTLGGYYIQQYPVPGFGKTPVTGVTWDQAKASCESVKARLCTELEWERACKGTDGSMYPYNTGWDPNICSVADKSDDMLPLGTFASCVTEEGVHDMVGYVWEWTSSRWGIPGKSLNNYVLRGGWKGFGSIPNRCSHRYSAKHDKASPRVGYRCCFGTPNLQTVSVPQKEGDLFSPIKLTDKGLATLKKDFPRVNIGRKFRNLRTIAGNDTQTIWRPVPNIEILVTKLEYDKKSGERGGVLLVFAEKKNNRKYSVIAAFNRPEKNGDDAAIRIRGKKETKKLQILAAWLDKENKKSKRLVGNVSYDCGMIKIKPKKWISSEDAAIPRIVPFLKTVFNMKSQYK
ncbi:MAG: SUMF1/EgtB/PvdO family nonheme iron enzyme [Deltaproteobacteria bacterium]|nr:SUMF1/EgtB/PvdO family nonheme iron enzyme [Deltaproteobacteria bacterium]